MSPDMLCGFKMCLNAFAAGAVPRTALGNLIVLPQISQLQLHLSPFEGRDGGVKVECTITANHSIPNNTIP